MINKVISSDQYLNVVLDDLQIIDVRAPCEYVLDAFPNSVNRPILDDSERAQVGTCYKEQGREAALALGHQLVQGENKDNKIQSWLQAAKEKKSVLSCFRGGLRSQLAQSWLEEVRLPLLRLETGTKGFKNFLRSYVEVHSHKVNWQVITGFTGSGKSEILRKLKHSLDLEQMAAHRGSAFGKLVTPQPAQSVFENSVAYRMIRLLESNRAAPIAIEDESRMIGTVTLPECLFVALRSAPVIFVDDHLESRIDRIVDEYVVQAKSDPDVVLRYQIALSSITKKLGGLLSQQIGKQMQEAFATKDLDLHRLWVKSLMVNYYDPLYKKSLEKRAPVVSFRGTPQEVFEFLSQA